MSKIDTTVLKDGQLAVATAEQSGTLISGASPIDTTCLVQTADGVQQCVKTFPLGEGGGGGGTSDYTDLSNKPQINDITLSGNKSSSDLGLADTSLSNLTPAGKKVITILPNPSSSLYKQVPMTLTITGNTDFVMPFDGYVVAYVVYGGSWGNISLQLRNDSNTNAIYVQEQDVPNGSARTLWLYVPKGKNVRARTSGSVQSSGSSLKLIACDSVQNTYKTIGSPTITNGIVSGFSSSNMLQISPFVIAPQNITERVAKIKFNQSAIGSGRYHNIFYGPASMSLAFHFQDPSTGYCSVSCYLPGMSESLFDGSIPESTITNWTWFKYTYDGTTASLYMSTDGENYTLLNSQTGTISGSAGTCNIGNRWDGDSAYFDGELDINETYIKADDEMWFDGKATE